MNKNFHGWAVGFALGYSPQAAENSYMEIWKYSGAEKPLVHEGKLLDSEFDDFVDQKLAYAAPSPPGGCTFLGGLRLIIQKYPSWSDNCLMPYPFKSEESMVNMANKLQLPKEFALAWSWENGASWAVRTVEGGDTLLHVVFSECWADDFWYLLMSYNARTHITSAILGYRPAAFEHTLVDRVRASAATAHHPLMLPLCVYELYLYRMIRYIESFRYGLFSIDTALGLNKNPATGVLINRFSDDYSELSKIIVSLHESLSSGRFIHLQQMPKTLEKAVSLFESMKSPPEISSVHEGLNVRLEFLGQTLARHLLALENYKSRIEMYSSTLHKLIAQRDNKLNISIAADSRRIASQTKRDSSAMKTIAVLTMIFLPGTFVSAMFSTAIFDIQSNEGPIMSKKAWVYWATMIPLTVFVVGAWLAWYHWDNQKQLRKYNDLENSNIYTGALQSYNKKHHNDLISNDRVAMTERVTLFPREKSLSPQEKSLSL